MDTLHASQQAEGLFTSISSSQGKEVPSFWGPWSSLRPWIPAVGSVAPQPVGGALSH